MSYTVLTLSHEIITDDAATRGRRRRQLSTAREKEKILMVPEQKSEKVISPHLAHVADENLLQEGEVGSPFGSATSSSSSTSGVLISVDQIEERELEEAIAASLMEAKALCIRGFQELETRAEETHKQTGKGNGISPEYAHISADSLLQVEDDRKLAEMLQGKLRSPFGCVTSSSSSIYELLTTEKVEEREVKEALSASLVRAECGGSANSRISVMFKNQGCLLQGSALTSPIQLMKTCSKLKKRKFAGRHQAELESGTRPGSETSTSATFLEDLPVPADEAEKGGIDNVNLN